jgi:hypothetical protein
MPSRHRQGRPLPPGYSSETGDGGRGRGNYGTTGGRSHSPTRGRDDGGGTASPERLGGGRGHERGQSFPVAAARWATALPGHWRRCYQAPSSVLTSERATTLVPAWPIAGSSPGSTGFPER